LGDEGDIGFGVTGDIEVVGVGVVVAVTFFIVFGIPHRCDLLQLWFLSGSGLIMMGLKSAVCVRFGG
jgi:hypothetical protein